jgi:predicted Zn-dependent peptidase
MSLVADRPPPGPPRPWSFPSFERTEVAGGRVICCHLPGKPLAVVSLVADAGAVTEPAGQEGVAEIVVRALSEGAGSYDAYGFAVAGERLGATWQSRTDWDSLRCGFEVPVGDIVGAAELLAAAVREPHLDEASLVRVRDERVDEIRLDQSQPGPRASEAFGAAVWADGCRYAVPDGGTAQSVAALTPGDIRAFHDARLRPDAVTLVIVGDLETADTAAVARAVFDGWSGQSANGAAPPAANPRNAGGRVVVVDRPGSVQSMLYAGHDAPDRRTPDYVPMTTMALVLGGMFNSRLNYRLREDKGYSYGAFGSFDTRRDGGIFVARSAVQTEVTAPALADAVAEIRAMHAEGATETELEQARSYRAGVFPINFAGPGAVAAGLADLVVHGLPDDHYDRLRQDVLDVGLDAVNAAAAQRLRPDDLVAVVVGDAAAVADELREIGLGPVEVLADEG